MRTKYKRRDRHGNAIAEMPVVIYLLIVGLLIPLIALATFGFRAVMVYMCVRDAAYQASKSISFTTAQNNALNAWNKDSAAWSGVSGIIQTQIIIEPGGTKRTTKLPTPYVNTNTYMLKVIATCTLSPIWGTSGKWIGMSIPGFTAPMPLTVAYSYYAENPQGLDQ